MPSGDFFKKIDTKIGEMGVKAQNEQDRSAKLKGYAEQIVREASPLLEQYRTELEQRGINSKLTARNDYINFVMYYADGGHRGLELRPNAKYNGYQWVGLFTNDDGRNYESFGGGPPLDEHWTIEAFEKYLQSEIESFMFYADRHGGLKR